MAFFNSVVGVLQTLVIALGAGLGVWGAVNLLEGYGNDNRATRSLLKRLGTKSKALQPEILGELTIRWVE